MLSKRWNREPSQHKISMKSEAKSRWLDTGVWVTGQAEVEAARKEAEWQEEIGQKEKEG